MNEKYLWDRGGEPDPEISRLEEVLRPLRHVPGQLTVRPAARRVEASRKRLYWLWTAGLAIAASLTIAGLITFDSRLRPALEISAWKISWNQSTPQMLRNGEVIETGRSTAQLKSDFVGEIAVSPESRLRVVASARDDQRLALEHGTIHALIWAPPAQFVVETPSAKTIDLGCEYTLEVAPDGSGLLHVETGWVAFQWHDLESFIPAGAECRTLTKRGPGLPYFQNAPAELRQAIKTFDTRADSSAVHTMVTNARREDALTLWHLMARTQGTERGEVFDRFRELVNLPPAVTRQAILEGQPAAMDTAWNALGFGDTNWWREWKRRW